MDIKVTKNPNEIAKEEALAKENDLAREGTLSKEQAMNEANRKNLDEKLQEPAVETSNSEPAPGMPSSEIVTTQERLNRDSTVLKTVHENLSKVADELVAQAKKEGISEGAKELLNLSRIHLDAVKPIQ